MPPTRCGQVRRPADTDRRRRLSQPRAIGDDQGRRLENFTRVETFGDNQANGNSDAHWLKVLVSPRTREVFAYQPQTVTANRAAVPAP